MVGGDTDTNASIFGQVVGAQVGVEQLPEALVAKVPGHSSVQAAADNFATCPTVTRPRRS